jgi:hypothetical protein
MLGEGSLKGLWQHARLPGSPLLGERSGPTATANRAPKVSHLLIADSWSKQALS